MNSKKVAKILLLASLLIPQLVLAQVIDINPPACPGNVPCYSTATEVILKVINIGLALSGLVAVLFVIIGGLRYITSFGNEDATSHAKKIIINAIIGVVIIILAFVIVRVVTNTLLGRI